MRHRVIARIVVALSLFAGTSQHAATATAGQGEGNPILSVSATTLPIDRVSEITITGTDYLVPPHAPGIDVFGGVYVFYGWVADPAAFGPSIRSSTNNAGTFGVSYAYPGDGGDPSTRDDGNGSMRLVSFTTGGESGQATDFHMDDDGNWTASLRIFGSTFTTTNPVTGEQQSYDCTQVQCGVFTIGAHGKASATNELFVPITFGAADSASAPTTVEVAPPSTSSASSTATTVSTSTTTTTTTTTQLASTTSLAAASADDATVTTRPHDGAAIAAGVTSVRSSGGSGALPIAAVALVLAAAAVALAKRRHGQIAPPP